MDQQDAIGRELMRQRHHLSEHQDQSCSACREEALWVLNASQALHDVETLVEGILDRELGLFWRKWFEVQE